MISDQKIKEGIAQARQIQHGLWTKPVIGKLTILKNLFYRLNKSTFTQQFKLNDVTLALIEAQNLQIAELQYQLNILRQQSETSTPQLETNNNADSALIEAQNLQIAELQRQLNILRQQSETSTPQLETNNNARAFAYEREVTFWDKILGMQHPHSKHAQVRLDPATRESAFPRFILPFVETLKNGNNNMPKLLEIGAGPISNLAWGVDQGLFEVIAVDPLADQYEQLMKKYGISYPIKPLKGAGEKLPELFDRESFDIFYARNALDHVLIPQQVVNNVVFLLKKGGFFCAEGTVKEGTNQNWDQLHQHDLTLEENSLVGYDKYGIRTNLTKDLGLECVYQIRTAEEAGGWYQVVFKKL